VSVVCTDSIVFRVSRASDILPRVYCTSVLPVFYE
jgi:hypothetical protein